MAILRKKRIEDSMSHSLDEVKKTIDSDYDPNQLYDANGDGVVNGEDLIANGEDDAVLKEAQRLAVESEAILEKLPTDNIEDPKIFLSTIIQNNECSTIGVQLEGRDVLVSCVYPDGPLLKRFNNYGEDSYLELCTNLFQLDMSEQYNCSKSVNYNGVKARVYANMPPLVQHPIITISTTKTPPANINLSVNEELLDKIVHSNFIVCGASGSGKTYLTNYLLSKYIKEDERIAFVEEFSELNPPNDYTICITTPPAKPDTQPLLKFVTEQTNLMRLDAVYVGEVKGAEAFPMVVNMASGTRGGCTIHGSTPRQALARLRTLCQLGAGNLNEKAIDEFIAKSINYVIQMDKHKITYIGQLTGTSMGGNFTLNTIFGKELSLIK